MNLPLKPEGKFVLRENHEISYFTLGDATNPCIILVHGLAANGLQFVEDAHWFADQGFYVIVPDLRGHGRSTFPEQPAQDAFTITALTKDMLAILDAENVQKVIWVGNSLGGILALKIMEIEPERLSCVSMFGTAFALKVYPWLAAIVRLSYSLFGVSLLAKIGAKTTSKNKHAQDVVLAMLEEVNVEPVSFLSEHLANYDLMKPALAYSKPMLMLRGAHDKQVNSANAKLLPKIEKRPNFESIELEQAGHCANLDQPGLVRQSVLAFVRRSS